MVYTRRNADGIQSIIINYLFSNFDNNEDVANFMSNLASAAKDSKMHIEAPVDIILENDSTENYLGGLFLFNYY